ncbi:Spc19-domain-containing protein [Vararia minispora EC-137]|uniref:Spc19-domain-containing protein n=1 Tax=Vararia minispora EC-137 TaxID=1314806 RepID=A0ACB8QYT8_9AGAM|nr:Spc19-domain-containing protein [Vararia minispora EC-137]
MRGYRQSQAIRNSLRPRGRESIFVGSADNYRSDDASTFSPSLRECVLAMEDCCEEAYEAQQQLRNGTYDLPRMARVLDNERVFLLVGEDVVRRYKTELGSEIDPQINELISRAEKGMKALQMKESILKAKVDTAQSRPSSRATTGRPSSKMESRRLQMLTKQRERLEQQLAQLETQVLQLASTYQMRSPSFSRML